MDQPADIPLNPKVDAIISDITQLMNEAEQMLSDSTSHHAEPQVELLRAHHGPESVGRCFTAFCNSASRALTDTARRTDRRIRSRPYQSMAIALGAGLLFGLFAGKRSAAPLTFSE
jgi:ElaB/YqjD/DUF883 family membrane-anchored ribosome-binding protein